jgi:nitroreductase
MELYEAMSTLRAVRRLRADPVAAEVVQRVLQAAAWAPTGGNVQPWRVIVVRERALKERLGALYELRWKAYSAGHRKLLSKAPAEAQSKTERMLDAGDYLAQHFGETPLIAMFCFNPDLMAITDTKQPRVSVVGGASIYTAVENFLLACRAEGLGCVLTTLLCEVEPEVRELLHIPQPWATAAAVPVGWPLGAGHGAITRRPVEKLAFADRWGAAWRGVRA